jgi:hypothetical protein
MQPSKERSSISVAVSPESSDGFNITTGTILFPVPGGKTECSLEVFLKSFAANVCGPQNPRQSWFEESENERKRCTISYLDVQYSINVLTTFLQCHRVDGKRVTACRYHLVTTNRGFNHTRPHSQAVEHSKQQSKSGKEKNIPNPRYVLLLSPEHDIRCVIGGVVFARGVVPTRKSRKGAIMIAQIRRFIGRCLIVTHLVWIGVAQQKQ